MVLRTPWQSLTEPCGRRECVGGPESTRPALEKQEKEEGQTWRAAVMC